MKYGDKSVEGNAVIYCGSIPFFSVIWCYLKGYKIIKYWQGTDAVLMSKHLPYQPKIVTWLHRIKMRILSLFITHQWVVGYRLLNYLPWDAKVVPQESENMKEFSKIDHDEFNVLWYLPKGKRQKFKDWCYGRDFLNICRDYFATAVSFVVVDGSQQMSEIYPYIDCYVRANRSDGNPMMVKECELNNIPVYWSPSLNPDLEAIIKFIENCIDYKVYNTTIKKNVQAIWN